MSRKQIKTSDILVVRSDLPSRKNYGDYRQELRIDFWFSCAYCSLTEIEASGIGFQIDHYWPRTLRSDLIRDYDNLYYACQQCNLTKGDFPKGYSSLTADHYVLRADKDDPRDHLESDGKDFRMLAAKSETGRFNIELLRLNRISLRRVREIRNKLSKSMEHISHGVRALKTLHYQTFPRPLRARYLRLLETAVSSGSERQKAVHEVLAELARSPLLDEDPNKATIAAPRRRYLKELRALVPPKARPARRTSRKGVKKDLRTKEQVDQPIQLTLFPKD